MSELRCLKPDDFKEFQRVGDPVISPDGKHLVYAQEWIDGDDDKKYVNLWLMDLEKQESRRLTVGKQRDTSPRWSPDGERIAFLSDRTDKNQIWLIDIKGGEAWQIETPQTPSSIAWSPDGTALAFCARVFDKDEDWNPYSAAPEGDRKRAEQQAESNDDDVSDVKVINRLRFRFDGVGSFGDKRLHVFVVAAVEPDDEGPEPRQLTEGDYDHTGPLSWSPDGRYIAFTAVRRDDADQLDKEDLWAVDVVTGRMTQLMNGSGRVSGPKWGPEGDLISFIGTDGEFGGSTTPGLWVVEVDPAQPQMVEQQEAVNLTRELDRPVGRSVSSDVRYSGSKQPVQWSADGKTLYFIAADSGASNLFSVQASQAQVETVLEEPGGVITAFSLGASGEIVYQAGRTDIPEDLWLYKPEGKRCQLTEVNKDLLSEVRLQKTEPFTFESFDGTEVEGFLLKPHDYEKGRRYPTVLFIHGGPHGAYGMSFMFQCQILASAGMAVMYTNPRGSQTYGQEFAYQVVEDWGGGDFQDIMQGVDEIIEMGIADPERLGVTGWSYGGFMTSWTVTQTDRFVSGIIGAPVTNRHSFFGTSDIGYHFGEHHCGGTPWDNPEQLLERSPLAYVDQVKTPVMLVHGAGDLRCPVAQSEEFYIALKRLNKETVMVHYPDEYHGISTPSHAVDRYERYRAWFEHYLID